MGTPAVITLAALIVLVYAYFGYPLLLLAGGRRRATSAPADGAGLPSVTVVIAAWNEERVITEKLENTLALDYPPQLLNVVVVSDGSTDETDARVQGFVDRTGRVQLLHTAGREGKSVALNVGIPAARGDLLVLTDANAMFVPDAIQWLVKPFADARVGAVSGELRYHDETGAGVGESAYWRYEQRVKRAESAHASLLGANGSIYALRRELFRPLHPRDVNDFMIPYWALLQGYQVVLEPRALSFEPVAEGLAGEYRRKVRIMARAIPMMLALIVPTLTRGKLLVLWQLISHKVLREIQGLFFAALLLGAAWGTIRGERVLVAALVAQVALYALGAVGWKWPTRSPRPLRLAAHFDMIVLASTAALGIWLTGRIKPTWSPTRPS
jgi:cellulose synthase/poly-beta-1,6-N-acetylglucosamine synthase-like glycosyltransferase